MSMTISTRIEYRNRSRSSGQRNHDLRTSKIPDYVDKNKSAHNSVIIKPLSSADLFKICDERRSKVEHKRKMKSDASLSLNGIITYGTEAQTIINNLSTAEQDKIFQDVAEAVAKRLNTTVTGLVVHRDEAAIHAHYQLPAYNLDGIPLQKITNRNVLKEIQDMAGKQVEYLQINRGKPKAERIRDGEDYSKTVHKSVAKLHDTLQQDMDELNNKIIALNEKYNKNKRLIIEQERKLAENKTTLEKSEKLIKTYEKRATDAKENMELLLRDEHRLREIAEKFHITQSLPADTDTLSTSERLELLRNSNNNQDVMST